MNGGLLFNEIYGLHIVCAIQVLFTGIILPIIILIVIIIFLKKGNTITHNPHNNKYLYNTPISWCLSANFPPM